MSRQRELVSMDPSQVSSFLASSRKVQLGTLNPDGSVHLVTMFYGLVDGQIAFWTYRTSQKALNLARDPRISCLVETGHAYFDLRGVQIQGTVETITDPAAVYQIGLRIGNVMGSTLAGNASAAGAGDDAVSDYVANAARKRFGYVVGPVRVISWDHSKLLTQ